VIKLQKGFEKDLADLKIRKQDLREVQKKYFKSSEKFVKERQYYWENFEKAQTKEKLNEMFQKKEKHLKDYKKTFDIFRNVYDKKNLKFEERAKTFLAFDTLKKKDYMLNWDLFTKKLIEDIEFHKLTTNKWKKEDIEVDCDHIFRPLLPTLGAELGRSSKINQMELSLLVSSMQCDWGSHMKNCARRRLKFRLT
jgi:hypothetical protein